MITLEKAKEQFLPQIELELCRIYPAGSKAPENLRKCYDHTSELHPSDFIFKWYRKYIQHIRIKCIGDEVSIYKVDDNEDLPEEYICGIPDGDELDELIDQAFDSAN